MDGLFWNLCVALSVSNLKHKHATLIFIRVSIRLFIRQNKGTNYFLIDLIIFTFFLDGYVYHGDFLNGQRIFQFIKS
jgi:hypothetical protein